MTASELAIIIVNWNGREFLPACLQSIVDNPPLTPFEIVIVDNASTDGSTEWLRSDECSQMLAGNSFRLIKSCENLGFGRANNLGSASSTASSILILNPDTLITPGALQRLVDTLWSKENIGIVAPKLVQSDGSLQYSVARLPETPLGIMIKGFAVNRLMPKRLFATWLYADNWTYDKREAVPIVAGAAMMCKRLAFDQLGGFDPAIFMYSEDFDLCVRARRAGWEVWFEPDAEVIHAGERSSSQRWLDDERAVVQERATIDFENRAFGGPLNILNCAARVLVYSVHCWRFKMTGRETGTLRSLRRVNQKNCKLIAAGYLGWPRRPKDS